jgi:integrase
MLKPYVAAIEVPHDLRRTTAKLCRAADGELEQIQMPLGHSSVQTTERYLGTKQDWAHAPNDGIKLKLANNSLGGISSSPWEGEIPAFRP